MNDDTGRVKLSMPNPYKVISLVLIAAFSLGAMTLIPTRAEQPDEAGMPTLAPLYAAPVDRAETLVLRPGETLSTLLAKARISGQDMTDMLLGLREHIDPRRLPQGAEITIRRRTRDDRPRTVDVRLNPDQTVRLKKASVGWAGSIVNTPIVVDTIYAGGTIGPERERSTVYNAVMFDETTSGLIARERPQLAIALASIYEYKLDFNRDIQLGDGYRVVFERERRPDGTSRNIRIISAEVTARGQRYPAIWFEAKDYTGFYDLDARALRHGFSRYPVDFARITSSYNPARYHPILGVSRPHQGTDFGGATGTPVKVTANGTVTFAGTKGGYGRMIEVRHLNGYITRYAHLSRFAQGIRSGVRVEQKQVIGYIGATGLATAPHLHYELLKNGRAVNAMREQLPAAPQLPQALREQYMAYAPERAALLDRVHAQYAQVDTAGVPRAEP